MFPSSICWRILPGVPTTMSIGLFKESSWGRERPPPLTMVDLNRAWWLIDLATRNTYKAHLMLMSKGRINIIYHAISKLWKYDTSTCSDSSLVGASTTARGRLGLISIPYNASSRLSNYKINKSTQVLWLWRWITSNTQLHLVLLFISKIISKQRKGSSSKYM